MERERQLDPSGEMTLVEHLTEVRDRLVKVLIVVAAILVCLLPFQNDLYEFLAQPLMRHLPEGQSMIATGVVSPFLAPLKLTFYTAVVLSVPVILYHLWAFVAPGLYRHEQRLIFPLLLSSTLLFYVGMAFAYYVVLPLVFAFLSAQAPEGVAHTPDISQHLDFVIKLFFGFGIAFEVPVATILLVWAGVTTRAELRSKRPYVIVGVFVVGMLLTPPDAISQTLLAIPMWALFELGIILSRFYVPDPANDRPEPDPAETFADDDLDDDDRGILARDKDAGP